MNLIPAHAITPGDYVLGEGRGVVIAVARKDDKVRLSFEAGSYVVKDAGEEMAVRGA